MERENEFNEKISEEELINFSKRIRNLSDKDIDELWFLCGFIISEREERYKAVRQEEVDRIRESLNSAKEVVWNLLAEIRLEDFTKNLSKIKEKA